MCLLRACPPPAVCLPACLCPVQSMAQPGEFLMTDFAKFDRPALLHAAFQALDAFEVRHGPLPVWPIVAACLCACVRPCA